MNKLDKNSTLYRWVLPILALLAGVLILHRNLAFSNLILGRGDTFYYFYPYWKLAADALREGRLPLWNPDLFMGAPLLANSQVGFYYPFNWPVWLAFATPYAAKASIVFHVFVAAVGSYVAGRRALKLSVTGAVIAALLFALGGYLSAQIEHINQAQGMAWMPWILAAASGWNAVGKDWRKLIGKAAAFALFFGFQLLAGHSQTTFITGVGVVIWIGIQIIASLGERDNDSSAGAWFLRLTIFSVLALGIGVVVALLISGAQILPTLELTNLSRRQGGLPVDEALSFSLHPLLFARALLPGYGQTPYAEYIAFLPVTALILAVIGLSTGRRNWRVWAPLAFVLVGVLFAFGKYNPLFRDYIINLPGFALFRAPSRWLLLYSFGASMLAGFGWDELGELDTTDKVRTAAYAGLVFVMVLMALVPLSVYWAETGIPMPPESPAEAVRYSLWVGWILELVVGLTFFFMLRNGAATWRWALAIPLAWSVLVTGNTMHEPALTTPEAYFDLRQSIARLKVSADKERTAQQPISRFLSMSKGYFDAGDQAEIDTIYADQLGEDARWQYTVNLKDKEIVTPNLTLNYGLSAVDGFDGGLLPLYDYAAVARLILPDGVETIDGRLRILIERFPDARWLDLFGVRYLIADRTADEVHVFEDANAHFDTQQTITLQPGESLTIGALPNYTSSEVWILGQDGPGQVTVSAGAASDQWEATQISDVLQRAVWSEPGVPDGLVLTATNAPWTIKGLALVDNNANSFQTVVLGQYRVMHSGDVRIYENLDVLPRAFVVNGWQYAPDVDAAVALMADASFDPTTMAIVEGTGAGQQATGDSSATVVRYSQEQIVVTARSEGAGLLVLGEAFYPGWEATVDGQAATIEKVDGMFRGVQIPAGEHEVAFEFRPKSVTNGAYVSAVGLLVLAVLAGGGYWLRRSS